MSKFGIAIGAAAGAVIGAMIADMNHLTAFWSRSAVVAVCAAAGVYLTGIIWPQR